MPNEDERSQPEGPGEVPAEEAAEDREDAAAADEAEAPELREISDEELSEILAAHKLWLDTDGKDGKQADLSGANLHQAKLKEAKLERSNLEGANLEGAELQGADLHGANLRNADLQNAHLATANLRCAKGTYPISTNAITVPTSLVCSQLDVRIKLESWTHNYLNAFFPRRDCNYVGRFCPDRCVVFNCDF